MNANEIIIITGDIRGISYVAGLMSYDDYMSNIVDYASDDLSFVHDNAKEIMETKGTKDKISEVWMKPNKNFQARFAYDKEEIKNFLNMVASGVTVDDKREIYLDKDLCSHECMIALFNMGLTNQGEEIAGRQYCYEKVSYTFQEGETLKSLAGHSYNILKCFNGSDLLVCDTEYNQYILCHQTTLLKKTVKDHPEIKPELGMQWRDSEYLGEDITKIPFDHIAHTLDRSEGEEYLKNNMSRMFKCFDSALENAPNHQTKEYMESCMEHLFMTCNKEEFDKMLDDGTYTNKYMEKNTKVHNVHKTSKI